MAKIKLGNKSLGHFDKGVVVGLDGDKKVKLSSFGELGFDEIFDSLTTTMHAYMEDFVRAVKANPDIKAKEEDVRKDIHDKVVMAFSLMADQFYPEAKESRFAGLTEEAVIRAQNEILKERAGSNAGETEKKKKKS